MVARAFDMSSRTLVRRLVVVQQLVVSEEWVEGPSKSPMIKGIFANAETLWNHYATCFRSTNRLDAETECV
jgi:hypothetical protein